MKRIVQDIFFALPPAAGLAALAAILMRRSEEKNILFFGFSASRLILAAAAILLTLFAGLMFKMRRKKLMFLYYISGFIGILSAELLLFSHFPNDDTRNLIPLITDKAMPLMLAMLGSAAAWTAGLYLRNGRCPRFYALFLFLSAITVYWPISTHIDRYNWRINLQGNAAMCLSLILSALLWCAMLNIECSLKLKTAAGFLFFCLLGYCVTRSTGMWMGRGETPPKAYWNELAEAFVQGRLYLENPSGTHDLTLYNGKWYVPNPPLPAILLMPLAAVTGTAAAINMTVCSAAVAGLNAGILFLMLIFACTLQGGPLSIGQEEKTSYPGQTLAIASWITVLFIFGTDHFWLGTTGQMWFISQLLVVTFTLLACICVICRLSPILTGIALGLGILSRPNIFPVWLCLLGIHLHQERAFPQINWKKTLIWSLKSAVPVIIAAALLLFYNKIRFDNWMDFGYVTINGADWILDSVRKYGMFHPHFLKTNFRVMFLELPELDFSGKRFFFQPHVAGYSVFLMTPPLIYVFRSFRKNWVSIGTWASVILSVVLLLLYHNTGAEQIGYRYLLDITAPLALLTADGLRGKVSPLYKILTFFALSISFTGIYWWYLGRA